MGNAEAEYRLSHAHKIVSLIVKLGEGRAARVLLIYSIHMRVSINFEESIRSEKKKKKNLYIYMMNILAHALYKIIHWNLCSALETSDDPFYH